MHARTQGSRDLGLHSTTTTTSSSFFSLAILYLEAATLGRSWTLVPSIAFGSCWQRAFSIMLLGMLGGIQ